MVAGNRSWERRCGAVRTACQVRMVCEDQVYPQARIGGPTATDFPADSEDRRSTPLRKLMPRGGDVQRTMGGEIFVWTST